MQILKSLCYLYKEKKINIEILISKHEDRMHKSPYQTFVRNCILGGSNGYPSAREKEIMDCIRTSNLFNDPPTWVYNLRNKNLNKINLFTGLEKAPMHDIFITMSMNMSVVVLIKKIAKRTQCTPTACKKGKRSLPHTSFSLMVFGRDSKVRNE